MISSGTWSFYAGINWCVYIFAKGDWLTNPSVECSSRCFPSFGEFIRFAAVDLISVRKTFFKLYHFLHYRMYVFLFENSFDKMFYLEPAFHPGRSRVDAAIKSNSILIGLLDPLVHKSLSHSRLETFKLAVHYRFPLWVMSGTCAIPDWRKQRSASITAPRRWFCSRFPSSWIWRYIEAVTQSWTSLLS